MVYIFDPKWFNGTVFLLDEDTWHMSRNWMEHVRANQPIPASFFPKSLTITRASAVLPDLFHASRGIIVVSERARVVLEELAPGQVEFIPVELNAAPTTWRNSLADVYYSIRDMGRMVMATFAPDRALFYPVTLEAVPRITFRLTLASAYFFINILGRAQRLLWLEMPTDRFPSQEDGVERFTMEHDFQKWRLRERAAGEPMIWHETHWRTNNREYRGHTQLFVEDVLWQKLDAHFPDQLHALRVGE
jgi:hypothetical protein